MGTAWLLPEVEGATTSGPHQSWDGVWLARVRHTPDGWSAEIEIPFRTLNFDRTARAWGINFQRTVRRKSENSLWMGYALNQGLARMSNAGRVEGLEGISQGLGLDLKPHVVGSVSSEPGLGQPSAHPSADVGIDAFYSLTPALRANLSVNTDFAETEVDVRRVNLTRFPLFFEEKRDFFLEGSSFFDFAREPDESVIPFFSRRIGLNDSGVPQHIVFGAKLTGEAGGFDVGLLQVRTGRDAPWRAAFPGRTSVLRLRRRVFSSRISAACTRPVGFEPGSRIATRPGSISSCRRRPFEIATWTQRILCATTAPRQRRCGLRPSGHRTIPSTWRSLSGRSSRSTTPPSASSSGEDIGA